MNKEKKLKYLDIIFENCEVYRLEPDMIYTCFIEEINKDIGINQFQYKKGEIFNYLVCNKFMLVINQKGLNQNGGFYEYAHEGILENRLKQRDITHIDLIYDDDTNDYITISWKDDSDEFTNKLQYNIYHTYEDEECLMVIISKNYLLNRYLHNIKLS